MVGFGFDLEFGKFFLMWIKGMGFREILRVRDWSIRNEEFFFGGVFLKMYEVFEINFEIFFESFVCIFL